MSELMNIAVSINEKYVPYAYVTLTSLFENNSGGHINVYVLYGEKENNILHVFDRLAEKYGQNIYYLEVDKEVFGDKLPRNDKWTVEIYYRLALPELLPNDIDRILYLDVDIIVLGSLKELYDMDLQGKTIGACKDMGVLYGSGPLSAKQEELLEAFMKDGGEKRYAYFNSGVLLMDIAKMRRENRNAAFFVEVGEQFADNINGDQDILNYVYHDDVVYADTERYNLFARTLYNMGRDYKWVKEHGVIVHFVGRKPWHYEAVRYNTEKLFWDYAKKTPYYTELLEQVLLGEVESGFMDSVIRRLEEEKAQLADTLQKCMDVLKNLNQ
ncbi:MAG: glycosyltransferase family 8 protein [Bacillus sp. (in: Bacteria)]|nr:glycosyltransferase family 8 protein [Bacillus sp. (in: firmicutes)]MCM1425850.1 glycosyltransferase family 8 protein [Eubacterium sp.]